ncbi:MAG: hypothetical protein V7K46_25130 [Nostoc sp.]
MTSAPLWFDFPLAVRKSCKPNEKCRFCRWFLSLFAIKSNLDAFALTARGDRFL